MCNIRVREVLLFSFPHSTSSGNEHMICRTHLIQWLRGFRFQTQSWILSSISLQLITISRPFLSWCMTWVSLTSHWLEDITCPTKSQGPFGEYAYPCASCSAKNEGAGIIPAVTAFLSQFSLPSDTDSHTRSCWLQRRRLCRMGPKISDSREKPSTIASGFKVHWLHREYQTTPSPTSHIFDHFMCLLWALDCSGSRLFRVVNWNHDQGYFGMFRILLNFNIVVSSEAILHMALESATTSNNCANGGGDALVLWWRDEACIIV